MVGASWSITMRTMLSMPLRPRSSTRVSPPVLRSRWKRSDSACMCRKVISASRRTACMATLANRPSRHWVSSAIRTRLRPYAAVSATGAASTQANQDSSFGASPVSASVAHLKVNGTTSVTSLATISSARA